MGALIVRRGLAALACLVALAGCSAPATDTVTPATPAASASVAPQAVALNTPTHLDYPAIGVNVDLHPTGLDAKGEIAVPPLDKAGEVDYLAWNAAMIATRPMIVVSHINGRRPDGSVLPGGFYRLSQATVGDTLTVTTSAGAAVKWRVSKVQTVLKSNFPTSIYDQTTSPRLVMITCGGQIDEAAHSYLSNILVSAVPA